MKRKNNDKEAPGSEVLLLQVHAETMWKPVSNRQESFELNFKKGG